MDLTINELFKNAIPPLADEEFSRLEQNILARGCREALLTWNGTIIDGHNRYAICKKHGIRFATKNKNFPSRKAALLWIFENQLGRRNLSPAARIEIAIKKAELFHGKTEPIRTTIAREAAVSENTVFKYMQIREAADRSTLDRLLCGEEKIGTVHRALQVTERRKLFSPRETAELKAAKHPPHYVLQNLSALKNLYTSLTDNLHFLTPRDAQKINELLDKLTASWGKCLP
jgi:hypothetical protein